jgi:hypothetical protein
MMVDYCATHAFATSGIYISGQSTGQIAGLPSSIRVNMDHVFEHVMEDLRHSMMQHGLDPLMIQSLVRQRCDELVQQRGYGAGHILGRAISSSSTTSITPTATNLRDLALQAAERRQRENQDHLDEESETKANSSSSSSNNNNHNIKKS